MNAVLRIGAGLLLAVSLTGCCCCGSGYGYGAGYGGNYCAPQCPPPCPPPCPDPCANYHGGHGCCCCLLQPIMCIVESLHHCLCPCYPNYGHGQAWRGGGYYGGGWNNQCCDPCAGGFSSMGSSGQCCPPGGFPGGFQGSVQPQGVPYEPGASMNGPPMAMMPTPVPTAMAAPGAYTTY